MRAHASLILLAALSMSGPAGAQTPAQPAPHAKRSIDAPPAVESGWPQLLGPTRNGVYAGPWSQQTSFEKLWERRVGHAYAGPVVESGRLLLFHREGGEEILESLDAASGKTLWRFAYPTGYRDDFGFGDGPRATPTVDGGRVYIHGAEGKLHCVDAASGKRIWGLDAAERFGAGNEFFGAAVSPLIEGRLLMMNIGGRREAGIVALDKVTGGVVWKTPPDEAGYASPVAATIAGERHALFFTRTGLVDTDPATGRIRFQLRWRARQAASVNAALPLAAPGGLVFLSASYGTGATVLQIQGNRATQLWSGDDSLSNHYATSVHRDGYLYGYHGRQEHGQSLRCIELRTGKVMWSEDGFGAGTVALAGGYLFLMRENGELVLAPAAPKDFRSTRRRQLLPGTVRAYPALASGRIYVRNDDTLAAFRID